MKTPLRLSALLIIFAIATIAAAQEKPTGSVEGRIFVPLRGKYLENAYVKIQETGASTLTESDGYYRFDKVPTGKITILVEFTGFPTTKAEAVVSGGRVTEKDIDFGEAEIPDKEVVKLDKFTVSASTEQWGASLALNEQRYAPTIKTVINSDEFGPVPSSNVGEFMRYMPGININSVGDEARSISINGAPAENVPILLGGFDLASASSSSTSRSTELEGVSINNIARIEVDHAPTPETAGENLAGSINLVPKSAFEYKKPQYSFSAYVPWRDGYFSLKKTPGPVGDDVHMTQPSADLNIIVPLNKKWGFTLSANHSLIPTLGSQLTIRRRGSLDPFNAAYPVTDVRNPYITEFNYKDTVKLTQRDSVAASIDYRISNTDRISFKMQWSSYDSLFNGRTMFITMSNVLPNEYDINHTIGTGYLEKETIPRRKYGTTVMPMLTWRHIGPLWKAEAGAGYSRSTNHYRDTSEGFAYTTRTRRDKVTITFDDYKKRGGYGPLPSTIAVKDTATGVAIDPWGIQDYALYKIGTSPRDGLDEIMRAYANLRRDFVVWRVPVSVKTGIDIKRQVREVSGKSAAYDMVGADGIATRTPVGSDDGAMQFAGNYAPMGSALGYPTITWASNKMTYQALQEHPTWFTYNEGNSYRDTVGLSQHIEETISAGYLRLDASFFNGRVTVVGGVRYELTEDKGEGLLNDPTLAYRRDASGNYINLNPDPTKFTPDLIAPKGTLDYYKLTMIERGRRVKKDFGHLFPSINVTWNITDSLILRGAWYNSIGRPDFSQYAGTMQMPELSDRGDPSGVIRVNNANIKPWTAESWKISLQYYLKKTGLISIGGFYREYENFFLSYTTPITREFCELYGIDYDQWSTATVTTQTNAPDKVITKGVELSYRQSLSFLPAQWMKGVSVFANASLQDIKGTYATEFVPFTKQTYNWGVSYNYKRFSIQSNWNYRGETRKRTRPGNVNAGAYIWTPGLTFWDMNAQLRLTKNFTLYASVRNILEVAEIYSESYAPETPRDARFFQAFFYPRTWTVGVRAEF